MSRDLDVQRVSCVARQIGLKMEQQPLDTAIGPAREHTLLHGQDLVAVVHGEALWIR